MGSINKKSFFYIVLISSFFLLSSGCNNKKFKDIADNSSYKTSLLSSQNNGNHTAPTVRPAPPPVIVPPAPKPPPTPAPPPVIVPPAPKPPPTPVPPPVIVPPAPKPPPTPVPPPVVVPPPPIPPDSATNIRTDLKLYPLPPLPKIGAAGSKFIDPTFGTTILRVTDSSIGSDCLTIYSYWPTFNVNNTRMVVNCSIGGYTNVYFNFDPVNFKVISKLTIPNSPPSGNRLYSSDVIWSSIDPDIIYGHNSAQKLWALNVSTKTYTLLKDFSNEIYGGRIYQMRKSDDDDVFSFHINNSSGVSIGYIVWKRSTNTIIRKQTPVDLVDEVGVDKTGRFLSVVVNGGKNSQIVDLNSNHTTEFSQRVDGWVHYDVGNATIFSKSPIGGSFLYRSLLDFTKVVKILPNYFNSLTQDCFHYSSLAKNELWTLVSLCNRSGTANGGNNGTVNIKPFDNEIFQLANDGSNRVRRFAHHRSIRSDYNDEPHASISRNGEFVAFGSNWGDGSGRRDVYVVRIPPAPLN